MASHKHCRVCAEACASCAEACTEMLSTLRMPS
jgi:predicted nucleic acid-binding Zn ribbon protein